MIRIDDSDAQRGLRTMIDKQMPFVIAGTINGLMLDAQKETIRGISSRLIIRRPDFLRRTIKITKFAKKRDQTGEIATDGPGSDIFAKFEEGGIKTPRGNTIAVPIDVRKTKRDLITAKNRPRALLDARKAFLIRTLKGGLILERYGHKTHKKRRRKEGGSGRKLRVLFGLTKKAKLEPRLEFYAIVQRTFAVRFDRQFDINFTHAMRTAR